MANVKFVVKGLEPVQEVAWELEQGIDGVLLNARGPDGQRWNVALLRPGKPAYRYGNLPVPLGLPLDDEGRVLVE